MLAVEYPIHAAIPLSKQAVRMRNQAAACHASQGGGRRRPGPFWFMRVMRLAEIFSGQRDFFMRYHPPPTNHRREKDLFEGI